MLKNRKMVGLSAILLLMLILAGCGATRSIVLMPDSDGHVGKAEVSTFGGKLLLNKPGDMTRVTRPNAPPSSAVKADPAYIAKTFGEALSVEPAPSSRFTLLFESGTTNLTKDSIKDIGNIVATSKQRRAINILIRGHTDSVGSDLINNKLAVDRAERVRAIVIQQGIDPGLISVSSHGKYDPAILTQDGVAEPRNRRVEVIVQ
jgi:outer membrane protein OmpA-like peptidoglycan-associated protein